MAEDGGGQAGPTAAGRAGGGAAGVAARARLPLNDAAERGDLVEVEALLAAGAETEARDEEHGSTAFLWACDAGQLECAQALAAAGCDVAAATARKPRR
jgi:ankyrin repeat protein